MTLIQELLALLITFLIVISLYLMGQRLTGFELPHLKTSEQALARAQTWLESEGFPINNNILNDLCIFLGTPLGPLNEELCLSVMFTAMEAIKHKHQGLSFEDDLAASYVHECVEIEILKRELGCIYPAFKIDAITFEVRQMAHQIAEIWEQRFLQSLGYIWNTEKKCYQRLSDLDIV